MAKIVVGSEAAGKTCPYCRFPLKAGVTAEVCDTCGAIHHEECWQEGGGCSVVDCAASRAPRDQPLPPTPEASTIAAVAPPGALDPHRRNTLRFAIAATAVACIAVVALMFVFWTGGGDRNQAVRKTHSQSAVPLNEQLHPAAVHPIGRIVFVMGDADEYGDDGKSDEVYVMNPDGSRLRQLTSDRGINYEIATPKWSPDRAHIAFVVSNLGQSSKLEVMGADGAGRKDILSYSPYCGDPIWAPSGKQLVVGLEDSDSYFKIDVLNSDGSQSNKIAIGCGSSFSPSGQYLAVEGPVVKNGRSGIWIIRPDGSGARQLTTRAQDQDPAWAPDGTRILFSGGGDHATALYTVSANGSGRRRIVSGLGQVWSYGWSPDGKNIALISADSGVLSLYSATSDGAKLRRLATLAADISTNAGPSPTFAWSPSGTKIAFARVSTDAEGITSSAIFVINADGSGEAQLTPSSSSAFDPDWG